MDEQVEHGFSRLIYQDIESFPIEILLGEAEEVLRGLKKILKEAKTKFPEFKEFWFVPDGVDVRVPSYRISRRGSVPDSIIETSRAAVLAELMRSKQAMPEELYGNFMGAIKLVAFKEESAEDMKKRPQSREERKALEKRERALYERLKKKFENE